MKTTLELPDDLLIEAKATAARRRTTLRAMVEHALRREVQTQSTSEADARACYVMNKHGLPVLKSNSGQPVTSEAIYAMMEEEGI